jgi:hypothetical protein
MPRNASAKAPNLTDHYRKLASEEVAMAKMALTNEARVRHYARAAEYWKLADAAQYSSSEQND